MLYAKSHQKLLKCHTKRYKLFYTLHKIGLYWISDFGVVLNFQLRQVQNRSILLAKSGCGQITGQIWGCQCSCSMFSKLRPRTHWRQSTKSTSTFCHQSSCQNRLSRQNLPWKILHWSDNSQENWICGVPDACYVFIYSVVCYCIVGSYLMYSAFVRMLLFIMQYVTFLISNQTNDCLHIQYQ